MTGILKGMKLISLTVAMAMVLGNYVEVWALRPPATRQTEVEGKKGGDTGPSRGADTGVMTQFQHDQIMNPYIERIHARDPQYTVEITPDGIYVQALPGMYKETGFKGHYPIRSTYVYIDKEAYEGENGKLYRDHELSEHAGIIKYAENKGWSLEGLVRWLENGNPLERALVLSRIHYQAPKLPDEEGEFIADFGADIISNYQGVIAGKIKILSSKSDLEAIQELQAMVKNLSLENLSSEYLKEILINSLGIISKMAVHFYAAYGLSAPSFRVAMTAFQETIKLAAYLNIYFNPTDKEDLIGLINRIEIYDGGNYYIQAGTRKELTEALEGLNLPVRGAAGGEAISAEELIKDYKDRVHAKEPEAILPGYKEVYERGSTPLINLIEELGSQNLSEDYLLKIIYTAIRIINSKTGLYQKKSKLAESSVTERFAVAYSPEALLIDLSSNIIAETFNFINRLDFSLAQDDLRDIKESLGSIRIDSYRNKLLALFSDTQNQRRVRGAAERGNRLTDLRRALVTAGLKTSVEELSGFANANKTVYLKEGGRAFRSFSTKLEAVSELQGDALVIGPAFFTRGAVTDALQELTRLSKVVKIAIYGEGSVKLKGLVGNDDIIAGSNLDEVLKELEGKYGIDLKHTLVVNAPSEAFEAGVIKVRQLVAPEDVPATLVLAKALRELSGEVSTLEFKKFLEDIAQAGVVEREVLNENRKALMDMLAEGQTFTLSDNLKTTERISKDADVEKAKGTVREFINKHI